jgi:hypothetical protein
MASPASTSPSIGQVQNPRKTRSPAPPAVTAALSPAFGSTDARIPGWCRFPDAGRSPDRRRGPDAVFVPEVDECRNIKVPGTFAFHELPIYRKFEGPIVREIIFSITLGKTGVFWFEATEPERMVADRRYRYGDPISASRFSPAWYLSLGREARSVKPRTDFG